MGKKKAGEGEGLTILNEDVFSTKKVRSQSVDLVVTSPPYNVDIQYNSHNDGVSYADYLEFSRRWMKRCHGWLRTDGRFCLNIPLDKNKDGQQSVGADLTTIAKECGFSYHSTIVWNEGNISRRTAWGSWLSASAPYVIAPVELIVVLTRIRGRRRAAQRSPISPAMSSWPGRTGSGRSTARKRAGSATRRRSRSSFRCAA